MRLPRSMATAAAAMTLTAVALSTGQAQGHESHVVGTGDADRVAGQYIVVLEDAAGVASATTRAEAAYGASVDNVYRSAIKGYSAAMTPSEAEALAQAPGVRLVQADSRVEAAVQSMPTGVDRSNADRSPTAGIDGRGGRVDVDVAVIDTGVDLDHPDLNVYAAGATNCSSGTPSPDDENGHGTHVAGTIGALDNRIGVVGVAPGARIWPVRVLGPTGSGTFADVICGIDYVTAHADEIEVANMSLGGGGADDGNCGRTVGDAVHQAICASVAAGVTYVVAAGNSSLDAALSIPASYDEVITVSALADFNGRPGGGAAPTCRPDGDDTFADFSNYGDDVDLIGPGVCITSTWLDGGYDTISGTSMASPHVAGAAALYQATHPLASPAVVRTELAASGRTGWGNADDPDATMEPLVTVTGY